MNIGSAVQYLKAGEKVARRGWNGKGMFLVLISPDDNQFFEITYKPFDGKLLEYVAMKTADGNLIPWLCSQADLLSDDWVMVD